MIGRRTALLLPLGNPFGRCSFPIALALALTGDHVTAKRAVILGRELLAVSLARHGEAELVVFERPVRNWRGLVVPAGH